MISVPGFTSKKKEPADQIVERLSSMGKSEREIINHLRKEGYPNEEISRALNKAIKFRVTGAPQPSDYSTQPTPMPAIGKEFIAPMPQQPFEENILEMTDEEEIGLEELVEEIVEEKWKESMAELKDVEKAIVQLQDQIRFLEEKIKHIGKSGDEKKDELKGLIEDSSTHIENIESRIGSVEKAFKEFLPSLTENVRSLSGLVDKMEKGK
ncbi:MAG: hypothetical protein KAT37_01390 [Candidatus Aenigmarchaeota archaeon]|nr:hypothetical protein [Candidatus Aenigmarchaeota archaeon]